MPAISCSVEEEEMISSEVRDLLSKGAVIEASPTKESFVSQIFLVEKKEGGQRPVINLKALNMFVKHEHFKMEGLHTLPDLIQLKDWMIKLVLTFRYRFMQNTNTSSSSNGKPKLINFSVSHSG